MLFSFFLMGNPKTSTFRMKFEISISRTQRHFFYSLNGKKQSPNKKKNGNRKQKQKKRNVDTPTPVVTTVSTDTNDENISTTKRDHTNKKNMVSQLLFLLVFFFRKNSEKPPQKKNPNQSFKRLHTSFFCAIVSPRGIFFFVLRSYFFLDFSFLQFSTTESP